MVKKKDSQKPEILYFSKEEADIFAKAIADVSRETFISNNSIFRKNEREFEVYDTRAAFLINVGAKYNKLLTEKIKEFKNTTK